VRGCRERERWRVPWGSPRERGEEAKVKNLLALQWTQPVISLLGLTHSKNNTDHDGGGLEL